MVWLYSIVPYFSLYIVVCPYTHIALSVRPKFTSDIPAPTLAGVSSGKYRPTPMREREGASSQAAEERDVLVKPLDVDI